MGLAIPNAYYAAQTLDVSKTLSVLSNAPIIKLMKAFWSWIARRLSPYLKPLLWELLEQEKINKIEPTQPILDQSSRLLREQLTQEIYAQIAPLLQSQLESQVHDILNTNIRVWGDRDRLHIAPTAATVNTLFNTTSGHITIGDYSFTGHNVSILTGSHNIQKQNLARMTDYPQEGHDIVIGQGVWIGSNATVLGPCNIGDHAVIAAGAVVLAGTVIPEGAIAAGIPAKVLRRIEFEVNSV